MEFKPAVQHVLNNYVTFSGRALRSEYWYWVLFTIIATIVLSIVDGILGLQLLVNLFSLAVLLPGISVSVRRLHDLDKSGWWLLLAFIPLIGAIVLIYWFCQKGTDGQNRFGASAPTA